MEFTELVKDLSGKKDHLHCLLVQPSYYSTYPPLGLLKISTLLKSQGYTTELVTQLEYTLYNYKDTPEDFLRRLNDIMSLGAVAYPMRYQPVDALEKDTYIAPNWSVELLEMVAKARRVLGTHGAFPSYEGLVKKFGNAKNLEEAMSLREAV